MHYEAVPTPQVLQGLCASVATDRSSVAAVVCGISYHNPQVKPIIIVDWSRDALSPQTLQGIIPAVASKLANLRAQLRLTEPLPDWIWFDPAGVSGGLFRQAQDMDFEDRVEVKLLTNPGALEYPLLPARAEAAMIHIAKGAIGITKSALEYDIRHRGVLGNFLKRDLHAWGTDDAQRDPGVLLVAVSNLVLQAEAADPDVAAGLRTWNSELPTELANPSPSLTSHIGDFLTGLVPHFAPVRPKAPPAPTPGVWLRPGKHGIDGAVVTIPADPARDLTWYPLPRWGRYVVDDKIFYARDPRAGVPVQINGPDDL